MVCLQSSFAQKNLAWEKSQSIRVKSASADLWCQCLPCFTTHICALCANSTSSWYEGNKELLFLEGTQKNNLSHTWISSKEDQPHVSKSKEDKSFVSAAMRYTLLSRKGREEGAERKRAQPIIFWFFFWGKRWCATAGEDVPAAPPISIRLSKACAKGQTGPRKNIPPTPDPGRGAEELRQAATSDRGSALGISSTEGRGPGKGLDPLGRLRGGWMEAGWRLDGAWSPSGPVGVRLAVRRCRRRQGPADCRVLVSTCCCSLQAELPNPARRHGRLLGNLPGSSAYRHSPQLGRGAGRERLQKIEQ